MCSECVVDEERLKVVRKRNQEEVNLVESITKEKEKYYQSKVLPNIRSRWMTKPTH